MISQYRRVNGSTMTIYTLSTTELIKREIEAYDGRRYIRDLYDILQLTNFLDKKDHSVKRHLKNFWKNVKNPVDEKLLPSLVYAGPRKIGFDEMRDYLKGWIK